MENILTVGAKVKWVGPIRSYLAYSKPGVIGTVHADQGSVPTGSVRISWELPAGRSLMPSASATVKESTTVEIGDIEVIA